VGRDGGGNVDNEQQILQNIQQLQAQIAANNKSALKLDVSLSSPIGAPLSAPTATSATASSSAELLNVLLGNRPQSNTSLLCGNTSLLPSAAELLSRHKVLKSNPYGGKRV
jgi:hypothetical protein